MNRAETTDAADEWQPAPWLDFVAGVLTAVVVGGCLAAVIIYFVLSPR